jgi:hypothetical protein
MRPSAFPNVAQELFNALFSQAPVPIDPNPIVVKSEGIRRAIAVGALRESNRRRGPHIGR